MWIDPRLLSRRINRILLKHAMTFLKSKVSIVSTGETINVRGIKAEKVAIEYDGPKDLLKIFGIKLRKNPIYSFVDIRILADISENIYNPLPIGFIVDDMEYIISINWPSRVGTNNIDIAMLLAKELGLNNKVIWIDKRGILDPLYNGFEEVDGFPISELTPGKIEDLAFEIARIYNVRGKEMDILNFLKGEDLLADSEISLLPQMDELILRWKVLVREGNLPKLAYMDAVGLPKRAFQVLIKALSLSDVTPVIASDDIINLSLNGVIYLTRRKISNNLDYYIDEYEDDKFKLIRRSKWKNEEVLIEEEFEPLWKLV